MIKILNGIFRFLKYILWFVAFGMTFYIVLGMYTRLDKNMIQSISLFVPYFILIALFVINKLCHQDQIINNIFYNLTCCLALLTIIVVALRALFDTNMVLNKIMGYDINFFYFNDFLMFMKVMIYGLCIGNIFFLYREFSSNVNR